MDTLVKITYLDFYGSNKVLAKVVKIWGYGDIPNKLSSFGISDNQVIKIERILTASSEDTETF